MNKKLILAVAALMIVALTVVAFAYTRGATSDQKTAAACCCKGDSCPMKTEKTSSTGEKASCCDNCDCCKDGKMAAGHGNSCPMGKSAEHATMASEQKNAKASCNCSCCNHKKDTVAAPAV